MFRQMVCSASNKGNGYQKSFPQSKCLAEDKNQLYCIILVVQMSRYTKFTFSLTFEHSQDKWKLSFPWSFHGHRAVDSTSRVERQRLARLDNFNFGQLLMLHLLSIKCMYISAQVLGYKLNCPSVHQHFTNSSLCW